jgi:hypothetical protein
MSLSAIRTEIKTLLTGVTDIGVVHDYERWAIDWNTILAQFKPAGKDYIRGWMITRQASPERVIEPGAGGLNDRTHRFLIKGIASLKDDAATEQIFQDLVESVCQILRANPDLNGSAVESDPPQVLTVEMRMFSQVLCHYAEIELKVTEYVTR